MQFKKSSARQIACYILFVALTCGALFIDARAQSSPELDQYGRWLNGISEPWLFRSDAYSETEASNARAKWQTIGSQIEAGHHEWAGTYRGGDLHASYLRWSPDTGFVLLWVFTCEANVTDLQYGPVSFSPGLVRLRAERPLKSHPHGTGAHNHGRHSFRSMSLVPIKWGPDRYLVTESQVPSFAEYLAGVGKFNANLESWDSLDYYQNSSDERVDLFTTAPVFPLGYEKFMRLPIVGKIVSVGRSFVRVRRDNEWWNDLLVPVTIDGGRNEGVRAGMRLFLAGSDDNETVEITRVGLHSSKGVIRRSARKKPGVRIDQWDDGLPLESSPIEVGSRLTSSQQQAFSVRTNK